MHPPQAMHTSKDPPLATTTFPFPKCHNPPGDPPRTMSPMGNMNKVAPFAPGATGVSTPVTSPLSSTVTHPATIPEGMDSSSQKIEVVVAEPDAPDANGPDGGKPSGADAGTGEDAAAAKVSAFDFKAQQSFLQRMTLS